MSRRKSEGTDHYSIRVPETYHEYERILRRRHPSITQAYIHGRGLIMILEEMIEKGQPIPEDPFPELIQIERDIIRKAEENIERITGLMKKREERASRTLAGAGGNSRTIAVQAEPAHEEGLKPGYHWETMKDERGNPVRVAVETRYE